MLVATVGHVSNVPEKEHVENVLHAELAKQAFRAAQGHRDPRFLWAMLREQGQLALTSGDRETGLTFELSFGPKLHLKNARNT